MTESFNNEFYTTAKSIINEFNLPLIVCVYEDVTPSILEEAKYLVAIYDGREEDWFDNCLAQAEISERNLPVFYHTKVEDGQYRMMVNAMDVISETCDRLNA